MWNFLITLEMKYCWFHYVCIAASLYNQILLARGVEIFEDTFLVYLWRFKRGITNLSNVCHGIRRNGCILIGSRVVIKSLFMVRGALRNFAVGDFVQLGSETGDFPFCVKLFTHRWKHTSRVRCFFASYRFIALSSSWWWSNISCNNEIGTACHSNASQLLFL